MNWKQQAIKAVDCHEIMSEDEEGIELLTDGLVTDEITELTAIAEKNNLMFLITGHDDGDILVTLKQTA